MTLSGESYERCAASDPSLTANYMQATRDAYAPAWTGVIDAVPPVW